MWDIWLMGCTLWSLWMFKVLWKLAHSVCDFPQLWESREGTQWNVLLVQDNYAQARIRYVSTWSVSMCIDQYLDEPWLQKLATRMLVHLLRASQTRDSFGIDIAFRSSLRGVQTLTCRASRLGIFICTCQWFGMVMKALDCSRWSGHQQLMTNAQCSEM